MAVSSAKRVSAKVVSAKAVANKFLEFADKEKKGKQLTNMQLQMLVYIAQGYTLAITDNKLYFEDTLAWRWGPVIVNLYQSLRKYGRSYVTEHLDVGLEEIHLEEDEEKIEIIKEVYKRYGGCSGLQLSNITQKPNTPWSKTWGKGGKRVVVGGKRVVVPSIIDVSIIKDYYLRTLEAEKEAYLLEKR